MTENEIFEVVRKNVLDVMFSLQPHEVTRENSLRELGANSLDRATIITQSLAELELPMPLVRAASAHDLGELTALMLAFSEHR